MNNELPALMLDSSCCYGKQGIILEWPNHPEYPNIGKDIEDYVKERIALVLTLGIELVY